MEQKELSVLVAEMKKQRPEMVSHLRALAACEGHPVATSATALMEFLLQQFDRAQQLEWTMRDLLVKRDKRNERGEPDYYWALKYNAADMVRRIHAAAGIGDGKCDFPINDNSHE